MIHYYRPALLSIAIVFISYSISILHAYSSPSIDDETVSNLEIIKAIPFYNASLSSIAIDTTSNRVYVSAIPFTSDNLCLQQNTTTTITTTNPDIISGSSFSCSLIYVLDGNTDQVIDNIRLRYGELIHDLYISPHSGNIYATGGYDYLMNDTEMSEEEPIHYEDDVVYIINNDEGDDNINETTSLDIQRIKLYGEIEEGKEGDMSSIAVDTLTNTIYAGIRYFEGGRAGIFVILIDDDHSNKSEGILNMIKFIPLGDAGPDQILVNNMTNTIYTSLEHDNFISVIDGPNNNTIKEEIILQQPQAMSINPSLELLYVASGDSNWFNVINMNTSKVVAYNTQISHPVASTVDDETGRVYVVNCLRCDNFDFTNGTSIYELDSDGSTLNRETYDNIDIEENQLAINPSTNKLYAIGTDLQSGISNLYVIDLSVQ